MKSPVIKRSIVIANHKTSVSLEDAFWVSLKDIANERGVTLSELVSSIDTKRQHGNLSSAIRLFVLDYYRVRSGHGSHESLSSNGHPSPKGETGESARSAEQIKQ
jgi:predicted DNA-binding ribbon-helix-helix protein